VVRIRDESNRFESLAPLLQKCFSAELARNRKLPQNLECLGVDFDYRFGFFDGNIQKTARRIVRHSLEVRIPKVLLLDEGSVGFDLADISLVTDNKKRLARTMPTDSGGLVEFALVYVSCPFIREDDIQMRVLASRGPAASTRRCNSDNRQQYL
jgi:hypothetical protein